MPFKIYTYRDPYKLNQADFWKEISGFPHFCVSRTLVNGLRDVHGGAFTGLLCPLDDFLKKVYRDWAGNVQRRIHQHSVLTSIFQQSLDSGEISAAFHRSLTLNQAHFLDAVRLLITLDMDGLDDTAGTFEQRYFTHVLQMVRSRKEFQYPAMKRIDELKGILVNLSRKELEDFSKRHPKSVKKRGWYECAVRSTTEGELDTIVIHGVHQFTPDQIRLVLELDRLGVTIIFLYNYQPEFHEIYSSWEFIYQCFEVPVHRDSVVTKYDTGAMQMPGHALACAMGRLCEGEFCPNDPAIHRLHQLYQTIGFIRFDNITEYVHHISSYFEKAKQTYRKKQHISEQGLDIIKRSAVLREMEEQVYTTNRDVHDLLKIYYPEYAKDRHFLAYPIGQFFSAIYQLWDYETGAIRIDLTRLKECLSSRILRTANGEVLLRTFCNLEVLLNGVSTFQEFLDRMNRDYLGKYESVMRARIGEPAFQLRQISIYNPQSVSKKDIQDLIAAIEEINEIAKYLFAADASKRDHIDFGAHFQKLETFLRQQDMTLLGEEEEALIRSLQQRLDEIKPENTRFSGTFKDLQNGIYYYMKQKEREDADWIVKNFEQIDGDILQSKRQFLDGERKIYHFACLSDYDMNSRADDLLPWPLTSDFVSRVSMEMNLACRVYTASIHERSSFLRYALFYGLFFNRCDTRLSFVRQYGDSPVDSYTLLTLLGFREPYQPYTAMQTDTNLPFSVSYDLYPVQKIPYKEDEMRDFFLCPYRFFLDYVICRGPVISDSFQYELFFENLLEGEVWRRISGMGRSEAIEALPSFLHSACTLYQPYFSFWRNTEIRDLERRAYHYIVHHIIDDNWNNSGRVKPYDRRHERIRQIYGKALFLYQGDGSEPVNPYPEAERLAKRDRDGKKYSLHSVPYGNSKDVEIVRKRDGLCADMREYLNHRPDQCAVPYRWCSHCAERNACMRPFQAEE